MSYPIPSVDPTDPKYPADDFVDGQNDGEVNGERMRQVYETIVGLVNANQDELRIILSELTQKKKQELFDLLANEY